MSETTLEKETCESCGVDVRKDTLFCYNCGKPVAIRPTGEDITAIETKGTNLAVNPAAANLDPDDELARLFRVDDVPVADKLAKAAAERRKARVFLRKPRNVVWELADESSDRWFVLITLLITAMAAGIVFVAVYLK